MVIRTSCSRSLILLLALCCNAGCNNKSSTVPIHGKVTFRSQPLDKAALTFFPSQGRPVSASVVGGEYTAEVPTGEYVVAVNIAVDLPPGYKEGETPPPPKVVLPDQYTTRVKSPLKASVTSADQAVDFDLK